MASKSAKGDETQTSIQNHKPSSSIKPYALVVLSCFLLLLWLAPPHVALIDQIGCSTPILGCKQNGFDTTLSLQEVQRILAGAPAIDKIREWSSYYTSESHLPGQGQKLAAWTQQKWNEFGIPDTYIMSHTALISDPLHQSLSLLESPEGSLEPPRVLYEAFLEEDVPADDSSKVRAPAFHGMSVNGSVTGRFVYANFGLAQDYEDLESAGIDVTGKIAIVKFGRGLPGLKTSTAAQKGVLGVVMYSDPQQDGEISESNGYKPYPVGPARPPTYIERANVGAVDLVSYDQNPDVKFDGVPSIPASYQDVLPILKALDGHGPKAADLNSRWHGGGLGFKGIEYSTGPSPKDVVLKLENLVKYVRKPLYNVFGVIKGMTDDEAIMIGNHRDAWASGAGDPNSGSAALMELVRGFAMAYKAGWKPRRSIMFASFDGGEIGQIGSHYWISEHLSWVSQTVVAYLNVVVAAGGSRFQAKASPSLQKVVYEAAHLVQSPNQTVKGQSVLDVWGGEIFAPGGGDATRFLQTAGIATVDLAYAAGPRQPVVPYHSNFDTVAWMDTFGDPGWTHHLTMTKVLSFLAVNLAQSPVASFNATDYAIALQNHVSRIKENSRAQAFSFKPLESAIARFVRASTSFDAYATALARGASHYDSGKLPQSLYSAIYPVNRVYGKLERSFYHSPGQDGDLTSKHVLWSPSAWYENPEAFPGIVNALKSGDLSAAKRWRKVIVGKIEDATRLLEE